MRTRNGTLLLGGLCLVLLVGCGGDETSSGPGGPGPGGAGGGAPGAGGTGGVSTASSASAGGSGGEGGAGGSGGGSQAMLDPDQVAKAAAVFGSCLPDDDGGFANHFLARVYTRYGQAIWDVFRDAVPCLATKGGGCQAVEECVGISLEKTGEICPGTCSGSVHSECFDEVGLKFVWDCAAVGYACSPTRGCVAPGTGETCDASTFVEKCEAGRPLYCSVDEVRQGPACSAHALACDDAIGSCRGTGAACSGAGHSPGSVNFEQGLGCEGAALRACVAGAEALRECAGVAQGFSCQTQGAKSYCGLGAECLAGAHGAPTCEGDQLVVCNGGKATKVDCLALGFTGCDPTGICTPVPWL